MDATTSSAAPAVPSPVSEVEARGFLAEALAGSAEALSRLDGWDLPVLAAGAVFAEADRAEFWAASAAYLNVISDIALFERALDAGSFDEVTMVLEAALGTLTESPLRAAALVLLAVAGAEMSVVGNLDDSESLTAAVSMSRQVAQALLDAVPGFADRALDLVDGLIAS